MNDQLSAAAIESRLREGFGKPLRYFSSIGSTNEEGLAWAAEGAPEGALVVTDHQTAGRGRWGRGWSSEPGRLLQFSLVLRPQLAPDDAGLITTALGVACAVAVDEISAVATRIKWPNDVTVKGQKMAGILVESRVGGRTIDAAVAGVGINVGWRREELPEEVADSATSLFIEAGRDIDRVDLLGAIVEGFERRYASLSSEAGRGSVIAEATQRSSVLGLRVRVRFAEGEGIEGDAVRLLANGALEVDIDGTLRAVSVGEIEQLRPA
jgi:BirA family biotin operon repressor/biotin-[acetyl-CoA-carboxylase] ligase